MYRVKDVLLALDDLCCGRCVTGRETWSHGNNRFVVAKSSDIPGKAIVETPGLVFGDPEMEVKKIAVMMTLTESAIELAAATGVNVIVAHHPVADAANSGGVLLKFYLRLYKIAVFELHEAFHGLHPGIPMLHGHKPFFKSVCYGGIAGNIVYVGDALPGVKTVGDMLERLNLFMDVQSEKKMLESERFIRGCQNIEEVCVAAQCKIILGCAKNPAGKIIHIFPHTGFNADHLESLMADNPDADTLLASISRVYPGDDLIAKAQEFKLNFVCGTSHAMEIFENGAPLAYAIRDRMPHTQVVIFRERATSIPLDEFGSAAIRDYAKDIASNYLKNKLAL